MIDTSFCALVGLLLINKTVPFFNVSIDKNKYFGIQSDTKKRVDTAPLKDEFKLVRSMDHGNYAFSTHSPN